MSCSRRSRSPRRPRATDCASADRERSTPIPEKKHLRGVSDKEQRQYEHIKEEAQKGGRYPGRAKEVAARTVMKQHKEKTHSKGR